MNFINWFFNIYTDLYVVYLDTSTIKKFSVREEDLEKTEWKIITEGGVTFFTRKEAEIYLTKGRRRELETLEDLIFALSYIQKRVPKGFKVRIKGHPGSIVSTEDIEIDHKDKIVYINV